MEKLLKKGPGWRLGWNPQANCYKALVGTDEWAIELTEAEFNDFSRLLQQLSETLEEMTSSLMDSETIACEAETELLWLEVEGEPQSYSLRMILYEGRGFEGNWAVGVARDLTQAIKTFKTF